MMRLQKTWGRFWSILLAAAVLVTIAAMTSPLAGAEGVSYYVDAVGGNDSNSGTSAASAWKTLDKVNNTTFSAGQKILLKNGCSFDGVLYPKGSGTAGNPIVISNYGTGNALPVVRGGNSAAYGARDAGVYLKNQSYWIIENLEVTNVTASSTDQWGIKVDMSNGYTARGITIRNNIVHGEDSNLSSTNHAAMKGIEVWSSDWYGFIDGLLIEGNQVYDVKNNGIEANGSYGSHGKGVVVRNNYLYRIGADGILITNCNAPLVEYNVVNESHNYSKSYEVALWPFSCTDALFQFNEAYNTKTTLDGHGLDSDYQCRGTTFQYNYAHDNEGGFILICCEPTTWDGKFAYNDDTIVRYNIGQNNSNTQFALTGQIKNTKIYNNTIYIQAGSRAQIVTHYSRDGKTHPDNTQFYNNIIYNLGSGGYNFGGSTNTVWQNNIFYGNHPSSEPADSGKITADPQLLNPGGATVGLDSCAAYYLKTGSPALGAGVVVADNGGRDFFGNAVSATAKPNIGAYNGSGFNPATDETTTAGYQPTTEPPKTTAPPVVTGEGVVVDFGGLQTGDYWYNDGLAIGRTSVFETVNGWQISANITVSGWRDRQAAVKKHNAVSSYDGLEFYYRTGAHSWREPTLRFSVGGVIYAYALPMTDGQFVKMQIPFSSFTTEQGAALQSNQLASVDKAELCLFFGMWTESASVETIDFCISDIYGYKTGSSNLPASPVVSGQPAPDYTLPYETQDSCLLAVPHRKEIAAFCAEMKPANGTEVQLLKNGTEVTSGHVGTGMELQFWKNGDKLASYTVIVACDLNGDGAVTAADLLAVKRSILGLVTLSREQELAANSNDDPKITAADLLAIKRTILEMN